MVAALVLVPAGALLGAPACSDATPEHACTNVPAGGCPLSRGVACADPTCEAVYACRPGNVWQLDHTCPAREAGAPREAAASTAPAPIGAALDAPPGASGGSGCGPLELPDCALGTTLACPPGSGCCGCEEIFVCQSGGWVPWGTCSSDAGVRARR